METISYLLLSGETLTASTALTPRLPPSIRKLWLFWDVTLNSGTNPTLAINAVDAKIGSENNQLFTSGTMLNDDVGELEIDYPGTELTIYATVGGTSPSWTVNVMLVLAIET